MLAALVVSALLPKQRPLSRILSLLKLKVTGEGKIFWSNGVEM